MLNIYLALIFKRKKFEKNRLSGGAGMVILHVATCFYKIGTLNNRRQAV
nr:MAG TPA: hypothetical protein [Caudoviricetes sp.]